MRVLPTSLFGRMFTLSLVTTLAALVLAGVVIGGVLQRIVTDGIDARLGDRLIALQSAVRADGSIDRSQLARAASRIPPDEPWSVSADRGGVTFGSGPAFDVRALLRPAPMQPGGQRKPPRPEPARAGEPFEARYRDGTRLHGLTAVVPTASGDVRVNAAVPRVEVDRPVLVALVPLAASLVILGLALGGAALLQLRIGLRPLTTLRSAVEKIRHGRATRVPEDVPDELAPLARELNALAAGQSSALAGARAAAANLAHALKTPVATLALHLGEDAAAQAQLARIDATLRHHLRRARSAATDRRARTALAPALVDMAETIAALHGGRVQIRLDLPDNVSAAIDPQDLDELAGNLIDNAARHATAKVTIGVKSEGRRVLLTVADDGPGISLADRERATMPGVRLDERGHGHGFGLAIARELAELYGGSLALDAAPRGGLLATVMLPTAA